MVKVNFDCIKGTIVNDETVMELDEFESTLDDALKEIDIEDKDKEDDFLAFLDKIIAEYELQKELEKTKFQQALDECLSKYKIKK